MPENDFWSLDASRTAERQTTSAAIISNKKCTCKTSPSPRLPDYSTQPLTSLPFSLFVVMTLISHPAGAATASPYVSFRHNINATRHRSQHAIVTYE